MRLLQSMTLIALLAGVGCGQSSSGSPDVSPPSGAPARLSVPVHYFKLKNGLKVVLSRDTTAPTVGRRLLPHRLSHRAAWAHGIRAPVRAPDVPGIRQSRENGVRPPRRGQRRVAERLDTLRLHELLPDRPRTRSRRCCGPRPTAWRSRSRGEPQESAGGRQERSPATAEPAVRRLSVDRPPEVANQNWYNSHNFYGDLAHLDAATLEDVPIVFQDLLLSEQRRPRDYRRCRAGGRRGVSSTRTSATIPAATLPCRGRISPSPARKPNVALVASEPACESAGPRCSPFMLPQRRTPGAVRLRTDRSGFGAGGSILLLFRRGWYRERAMTGGLDAGNKLGASATCSTTAVQCCGWRRSFTIRRRRRMRWWQQSTRSWSAFERRVSINRCSIAPASRCGRGSMGALEEFAGFGRADLLASFALFDDDPGLINQLEDEFAKVTPAVVQKTAEEYLCPGNRTIYTIEAGKASESAKEAK